MKLLNEKERITVNNAAITLLNKIARKAVKFYPVSRGFFNKGIYR